MSKTNKSVCDMLLKTKELLGLKSTSFAIVIRSMVRRPENKLATNKLNKEEN